MPAYDAYHSWAATQYREKARSGVFYRCILLLTCQQLDATLAGKTWSISAPPADTSSGLNSSSPPGRPSSAQGLRKSRASARNTLPRSSSPASFGSRSGTPNAMSSSFPDQKSANEAFFATLGEANASRPDNLPPSQGGRYQGFGNTPSPSQNPSYGLSSAAAPSLTDFQENPLGALSKGWSLFSSAVVGASRVVSENIIQPGVEKVMDPNFQSEVKGYVSEASKRAGEVGKTANMWTKHTLGVDVAESVGGVYGTVRGTIGGGPSRQGYGSLQTEYVGESSTLYHDHEEEDDFFDQYAPAGNQSHGPTPTSASGLTSRASAAKKSDDWDEWKDF